jgi:hypothetical protein
MDSPLFHNRFKKIDLSFLRKSYILFLTQFGPELPTELGGERVLTYYNLLEALIPWYFFFGQVLLSASSGCRVCTVTSWEGEQNFLRSWCMNVLTVWCMENSDLPFSVTEMWYVFLVVYLLEKSGIIFLTSFELKKTLKDLNSKTHVPNYLRQTLCLLLLLISQNGFLK